MRRGTTLAFVAGVAVAAAATFYAGSAAVLRALQSLHALGLLLIAVLHLPAVALMGFAWYLVSGDPPPASRARFLWARFVRDAGAEVLPFSQLGGFLLGLRALGRGRHVIARGAVSMSTDLVIELIAKLPYVLAGLLALTSLAPHSGLIRTLSLALVLTAATVALVVLARHRVADLLSAMARAVSRRWPAVRSLDDPGVRREIQTSFAQILGRRARLTASGALHLTCWGFGAIESWVLFHLLGVPLSLLQALAIDSTVSALRTFGFMIPAAAGVQEASYLLGATLCGVPAPLAIAASFARRARDLTLGAATFAIACVADPHLAPATVLRADQKG